MIKDEIVQKMIRKVSFYIWENSRLTHKEEVVQVFGKETLFDGIPLGINIKLKEKYGDDMVQIRKVLDYV